jgi:hypothetical protein
LELVAVLPAKFLRNRSGRRRPDQLNLHCVIIVAQRFQIRKLSDNYVR